jgi:dihydrofolate reductase
MPKLILQMSMSLDGFVAEPNGELNWGAGGISDDLKAWILESVWGAGAHVMGRGAYEEMAAYWPTSSEAFAAPMNELPKIVFSKSLDKATWNNSRVVSGDVAEEIARLKQQPGKDLLAHGGARFAQSIVRLGLVDEYQLKVYPVALGRGLALFKDLRAPLGLRLQSARAFDSGVVVHSYAPR